MEYDYEIAHQASGKQANAEAVTRTPSSGAHDTPSAAPPGHAFVFRCFLAPTEPDSDAEGKTKTSCGGPGRSIGKYRAKTSATPRPCLCAFRTDLVFILNQHELSAP
eukprot:Selendium_serpulae@DN11338_c0_g1_i1.p1